MMKMMMMMKKGDREMKDRRMLFVLAAGLVLALGARAQEPAEWEGELVFHTFSIAAIDPSTGEVGVAVTTRNACVGNGVPWVRVGVGAVATQARTRTEYGAELLDFMEQGLSAEEALKKALSADDDAPHRQVGVIGLDGGSAQHTGEETNDWAGDRAGPNYVTQGNLLVGPEVLPLWPPAKRRAAMRGKGACSRRRSSWPTLPPVGPVVPTRSR
jgi:hypothetical protein